MNFVAFQTAQSIVYPEDVSSVNERAVKIVSSPTIDTKITTPAEEIRSEEVADEGVGYHFSRQKKTSMTLVEQLFGIQNINVN